MKTRRKANEIFRYFNELPTNCHCFYFYFLFQSMVFSLISGYNPMHALIISMAFEGVYLQYRTHDCLKASKVNRSGILSIKCHTELFSINNSFSHQKVTLLWLFPMLILYKIQKIEDVQHTTSLSMRVVRSMKVQQVLLNFASDLALCFLKYGLALASELVTC